MKYLVGHPVRAGHARLFFGTLVPLLAVLLPMITHGHSGETPYITHSTEAAQHLTATPKPASTRPANDLDFHTVITTVFWIGEPADSDNGYIANVASAWDGQWQQHYGGKDDPVNRHGYLPAAFSPRENSFYVALPYTDFTNDGLRKATARNCQRYSFLKTQPVSWCKNTWVAIAYGNKIAYAQWEDVGPFEDNDTAYVFGTAPPANQHGARAGLDVSPAVRDYLGLGDVSTCKWAFVSQTGVPTGPWLNITTTNNGDALN